MSISAFEYIMAAPSDGVSGSRGPLPLPAGEYSSTVTYTATNHVTSYVLFNGIYYVMNKIGSWLGTSTGKTPAQDYAANGNNATWIPFENFKAIYVELLFAKFGLLGSAVFYEEFMFSKQGVDVSGNETSDYSGFTDGTFTPHLQLNFKTGELIGDKVKLRGEIEAVRGVFHGFAMTPFSIIETTSISLPSPEEGTNIMLTNPNQNLFLTLPTDLKYNGLEIEIMYAAYSVYYAQINNPGGGRLYWRSQIITHILLFGDYSVVRLRAFKDKNGILIWRVVNNSDFKWINGGAGSNTSYIQWIQA